MDIELQNLRELIEYWTSQRQQTVEQLEHIDRTLQALAWKMIEVAENKRKANGGDNSFYVTP